MPTRYHFSVAGGDNKLGFTAAVWAHSADEAVALLNAAVDTGEPVIHVQDNGMGPFENPTIEYVAVFANGLRVTDGNINESSADDEPEPPTGSSNRRLLGLQNLGSPL